MGIPIQGPHSALALGASTYGGEGEPEVTDGVNLHGYERIVDPTPGRPAAIAGPGSTAGRFEVALGERRPLVAEVEVHP